MWWPGSSLSLRRTAEASWPLPITRPRSGGTIRRQRLRAALRSAAAATSAVTHMTAAPFADSQPASSTAAMSSEVVATDTVTQWTSAGASSIVRYQIFGWSRS